MAFQSIDPVAETPADRDELQQKVWLTPQEAARYVGLASAQAFFMFRQRVGLKVCYRYRRTELDALIERQNRLTQRRSASPRQSHRKAS